MTKEIINLALKFSYVGRNYHGNALQGNINTVSYQLVSVLKQLNLYVKDPVLCGRTDKGVNAKNMVCNVHVYKLNNCQYADYLNYYLPKDIRINSYAIMPDNFNARFDCTQRHYKYFFTDYNPKMEDVCKRLMLVTDFRGMCVNESNTKRSLDAIFIEKTEEVFILNVKARGFLYNMVRKIFWVLSHAHVENIDGILDGTRVAGTSKPDGLVFCCASYNSDIKWIETTKKSQKTTWVIQKEIEKFINNFN